MKGVIKFYFSILLMTNVIFSQTWIQQTSPTTNLLKSVSFYNSNYGVAVGLSGTIISTTNGGTNWVIRNSGTTNTLNKVKHITSEIVIAVGNGGTILRSTDGGITWSSVNSGTTENLFGISFTNSNMGLVVGGVILKTSDSGLTWQEKNSGAPAYLNFDVVYQNNNNATILAQEGTIRISNDGGETWTGQAYKATFCQKLSISDENTITAVGGGGAIRRTTDGGNTWVLQNHGLSNDPYFYDVSFTDINNGTAVGQVQLDNLEGLILRTTNGGQTWFKQNSGTSNSLVGVSFIDANAGYVVGEGGIILKTNDGALPVELISFDYLKSNSSITINWETATEINNYGFEVEKKTLHYNWTKIGFVNGFGNSNSPKKYSYIDKEINSDEVFYRLKQIDFDGAFEYSKEIEVYNEPLTKYKLNQNHPNPFNPTTFINYSLPKTCKVTINLYDVLGRLVKNLVDEEKFAGNHKVELDASNLASGIYFYKLQANEFTETKKMLLIR